MKIRKIITVLITLALITTCLVTTASAAGNSENTREFPMTIYVNNQKVTDANAYCDLDDNIWIYYEDLCHVFPSETLHVFIDNLVGKSLLSEWASDFNYTMIVRGSNVYLTGGSSDVQSPENNRMAMPVYLNGERITGVSAYKDQNSVVWISYSDLYRLFPDEVLKLGLPGAPEEGVLSDWANLFGYKMTVSRDVVYLDKDTSTQPAPNRTAMSVYVSNKKVSNVTVYKAQDGNIYVSYADLCKIFTKETAELKFPATTEETVLKDWATIFGYTMSVKSSNVYLDKNTTPTPNRTAMSVYVSNKKVSNVTAYKAQDGTIYVSYTDLCKVFTKEAANLKFPATTEEAVLKEWATLFGYTMSVKSNNVYLEKNTSTQPTPNQTDMSVYVSNKKVSNVMAYKALDGNIYVSYANLCKIFVQETKGLNIPSSTEGALLKEWANLFGYTMSVKSNNVYLEKSTTSQPSPGVQRDPMKVYVNGIMIQATDVYAEDGIVKVGSFQTFCNIFPQEWSPAYFTGLSELPLKTYAELFGYSFVQTNTRVYLNNDKQKPLEIVTNGTILDFPDQQPIILNGRTMVPVRALSETLGWQVGYANQKVTITSQKHTIVLWIGSTTYTIDGVEKVLDVPAQIMNGRTMVPIRFISEAFGFKVEFNGKDAVNRVTLTK